MKELNDIFTKISHNNIFFVLYGSYMYKQRKWINRNFLDVDVILKQTQTEKISKTTERWKQFILNFEIIKKIKDELTHKIYLIKINNKIIKIESLLNKFINNEFIENWNGIKVVNYKYFKFSKIIQLLTISERLEWDSKNIDKTKKIQRVNFDLSKIDLKINNRDSLNIINCFLLDAPINLLSSYNHPLNQIYNSFSYFNTHLNKRKIFIYLNKIKNNSSLKKFNKFLFYIYELRNVIFDTIIKYNVNDINLYNEKNNIFHFRDVALWKILMHNIKNKINQIFDLSVNLHNIFYKKINSNMYCLDFYKLFLLLVRNYYEYHKC
ncbi:hypothetical protein [Mycoplasma hafezii]|uniref:hypothetical protein n=1 Tax=Mycoplasma hafezii TaxID=525886 RepID=UPI003CF1620A